jgi:enoyl-CoA hydratase
VLPPYQNLLIPDRDHFVVTRDTTAYIITLCSEDGMNRLTREKVTTLTGEIERLSRSSESSFELATKPLVIRGERNFSAGADLNEISTLNGPEAYRFSALGQVLMDAIGAYPAPVIAAIDGHCMGGGLDLALACHHRIAASSAVFGHRGAALGLITGWGGTQRLPRLIGKGRALELLTAAEKISAQRALEIGLVDVIADDPVAAALRQIEGSASHRATRPLVY